MKKLIIILSICLMSFTFKETPKPVTKGAIIIIKVNYESVKDLTIFQTAVESLAEKCNLKVDAIEQYERNKDVENKTIVGSDLKIYRIKKIF